MLAPVAAGIAAGIIGFLPLFISLRLARRSTSLSAMSAGLYGLAGTFVSLIVVAVALIVCAMVARLSCPRLHMSFIKTSLLSARNK